MTAKSNTTELVITRLLAAPRALVFQCWTQSKHLQQWQGAPEGFTVTTEVSDIRPGGSFKICMRSPEGVEHWLQGSYREIVEPERLVFSHCWLNAEGKPGNETLVTITFAEREDKTELTLKQSGFPTIESRDGHQAGWKSALEVLSRYLEKLV